MNRQELEQLILENIPDNNEKFISAALLREVLNAINDEKFQLDEDTLRLQLYNLTQTLEQRLQGLPIERRAILGPYTWTEGTESVAVIDDPDEIILTATKTKVTDFDIYIDIEFTENIIGKSIDFFSKLPNDEDQATAIPSGQQLVPTPIVPLLDPISSTTRRIWQTRRSDQNVQFHAVEIILK